MKKILGSPIISVLWMLYALYVFYLEDGSSFAFHNKLTLCVSLSYFFCYYTWFCKGNRFFSLFILFVTYSLFSNLGQSLVYSFSEDSTFLSVYNTYRMSDICYMLKYNFLCIAALYLGVSICLSKKIHNVGFKELSSFYINKSQLTIGKTDKLLRNLLFISLLVVLGYSVYQLQLRQTMSYHELYESRDHLSGPFTYIVIIVGLYFIFQKRYVKTIIAFWLFFIIAFFVAGTRSMALIYVGVLFITMPILFPRLFQPKYYPYLILLLLLGFASLSVISSMRNDSIGSSDVEIGFSGALLDTVLEMGASQLPTMITIEHFHSYPYSQTILYFLMMGIFPASLLNLIVPDNWQLQLGGWVNDVSNTIDNQLGFSWIAETYLNYGQFGWIFVLIYGFFIAYAENKSLRRIMEGNYLLALCLLGFLSRQLFFARGNIILSIDFFKTSVYLFLILIIIKTIRKKHKNEDGYTSRRVWD